MGSLNFWGYVIGGIIQIVIWVMNPFPVHTPLGLAQKTLSITSTTLGVLFVVIFSQINMIMPMLTFTVMFVLEAVRVIYAAWRWVKRIFID